LRAIILRGQEKTNVKLRVLSICGSGSGVDHKNAEKENKVEKAAIHNKVSARESHKFMPDRVENAEVIKSQIEFSLATIRSESASAIAYLRSLALCTSHSYLLFFISLGHVVLSAFYKRDASERAREKLKL
jgi:hypothetical protein